jgi:hypothetical protein
MDLDKLTDKNDDTDTVLELSAELRSQWGKDFLVKQSPL